MPMMRCRLTLCTGRKSTRRLSQGGRIDEQQRQARRNGSAYSPAGCACGENVTGARSDQPPYRYRIRVRGRLGETIWSAFPALQAHGSGGDTVLTGTLPDRAALHGVLAEIEVLGLELLEVRRLPPV
jgi:hypothetical protein